MCCLYFVSIIPCDSVSQAIAHLTDTPAEISLAQAKSRNTRSTHSGTERNKLHRNLGNVCVDGKKGMQQKRDGWTRWAAQDGLLQKWYPEEQDSAHPCLFPHYPFPLSTTASTSLIRTSSWTNDIREGQQRLTFVKASLFLINSISSKCYCLSVYLVV